MDNRNQSQQKNLNKLRRIMELVQLMFQQQKQLMEVDRKINERRNNRVMVSNRDLFRLGNIHKPTIHIYSIFYSCHLHIYVCVCFLFSWLLLSHVFVHAFIRLFDFIVINGVNLMTKSTPVFQQPNSLQNQ